LSNTPEFDKNGDHREFWQELSRVFIINLSAVF